jgi:hypothetical protein
VPTAVISRPVHAGAVIGIGVGFASGMVKAACPLKINYSRLKIRIKAFGCWLFAFGCWLTAVISRSVHAGDIIGIGVGFSSGMVKAVCPLKINYSRLKIRIKAFGCWLFAFGCWLTAAISRSVHAGDFIGVGFCFSSGMVRAA